MSIKLELEKDLEKRFREAAMKVYGFGKGAISKAAQEAIRSWLEEVEVKAPKSFDPVEELRGLIKKKGVNSVTLRHEITKLWMKKGFE